MSFKMQLRCSTDLFTPSRWRQQSLWKVNFIANLILSSPKMLIFFNWIISQLTLIAKESSNFCSYFIHKNHIRLLILYEKRKKSCLDWRHQDSTNMHSYNEGRKLVAILQYLFHLPIVMCAYTHTHMQTFVLCFWIGSRNHHSINKNCSMNLFLACNLIKPNFFFAKLFRYILHTSSYFSCF